MRNSKAKKLRALARSKSQGPSLLEKSHRGQRYPATGTLRYVAGSYRRLYRDLKRWVKSHPFAERQT